MTTAQPETPLIRIGLVVSRAPDDPLQPIIETKVNILPLDWIESRVEITAKFLRWQRKHVKGLVWVRPLIRFPEPVGFMPFPWTDSWRDTKSILQEFASTDSGVLYDDIDQGWEALIERRGGRLFVRYRNPDDDEPYTECEVDSEPYARAAREELNRGLMLLPLLVRKAWPNPITRFGKWPFG